MNGQSAMRVADLDTPVLLIDGAALERNIARMRELAEAAGLAYRPHAKAHKSPVIAKMQIAAGACGVCCAKLGEAEVMAAGGIDDILITAPVIGLSKIARLMRVAAEARVAVVVDDAQNVAELAAGAQTAGTRLAVLVEVDVGQGRCGVAPGEAAADLASQIGTYDWLDFRGLQGYQGKIQMTANFARRKADSAAALALLSETAAAVRRRDIVVHVLTGGGTGTSAIDAANGGLTEIQPGGYIFMDARYGEIEWDQGAPVPFEKSLTLLAGVISRPAPDRAILDMGYKAVSSDGGKPVPIEVPGAEFSFAGEEHGQLSYADGPCPLDIGDKVSFWPSHCDTTVNLYDQFIVTRGELVETVWPIAARGRVQ